MNNIDYTDAIIKDVANLKRRLDKHDDWQADHNERHNGIPSKERGAGEDRELQALLDLDEAQSTIARQDRYRDALSDRNDAHTATIHALLKERDELRKRATNAESKCDDVNRAEPISDEESWMERAIRAERELIAAPKPPEDKCAGLAIELDAAARARADNAEKERDEWHEEAIAAEQRWSASEEERYKWKIRGDKAENALVAAQQYGDAIEERACLAEAERDDAAEKAVKELDAANETIERLTVLGKNLTENRDELRKRLYKIKQAGEWTR